MLRLGRAFARTAPVLAAVGLALALDAPASAQTYPDRPIKVMVGFPAGSGADILCRHIIDGMAKLSSATFVIENKPGAAGNIGSDAAATSKLGSGRGEGLRRVVAPVHRDHPGRPDDRPDDGGALNE